MPNTIDDDHQNNAVPCESAAAGENPFQADPISAEGIESIMALFGESPDGEQQSADIQFMYGQAYTGDERVGETFIPWKKFFGSVIPDPVMAMPSQDLSLGAKVCYGVLARHAGRNGECYPSMQRIGKCIGVSEGSAKNYVRELKKAGYIAVESRKKEHAPNRYRFLWHNTFVGLKRYKGQNPDPYRDRILPTKRVTEESLKDFKASADLDYQPDNCKGRNSPAGDAGGDGSECKAYGKLREALADYMQGEGQERVYPPDRLVVDVMDAAGGSTEQEGIACLNYLLVERGLKPWTQAGPHYFAWFKTTVAEYFYQKTGREQVFKPTDDWDHRHGPGTPQTIEDDDTIPF